MKRTYIIIVITVIAYICGQFWYKSDDVSVAKELTLKDVSVVIDPGHGGC